MLMADLGADVIKIEAPDGGDSSRGMTVLPGMPSTFFETNNRGVKSVTLNLKSPGGPRHPAQAGRQGRHLRPELPARRGREERLRLRGAAQGQPQARLCLDLGLRPAGARTRHLPGTDSMAQALGGIAEAYSTPGQPMRTGIASVADETCAILAFGGALAALTHARATGIGQKVELSLLGAPIRLMGWTFTTTMWRNRNPVTGQARITGTPRAARHQRQLQRPRRQAAGVPAQRPATTGRTP